MGISDVVSPISRKGSKAESPNLGLSPGARSDPGRVGGPKFDSVPPQPMHRGTSAHHEQGGVTKVVGPK